jgi:hypothetical protein
MNRPHEMAAKPETPAEKLGERLPNSFEDPQRISDQLRPVEDLHSLLLRISHHLDYETSERKTIYYRLQEITLLTRKAVENQVKGRASRQSFVPYLVAICIGVAATLAWQSYGTAYRQIIATRAPELGWSPEAKQMIASWVQQLGWTKPPPGQENTVRSSVPETPQSAPIMQATAEAVAPKAPATASIDPKQVQQLEADIAAVQQTVQQQLAAVRQTVDQVAADENQMAREIAGVLASNQEILEKIPTPPAPPSPRPTAALGHKPTPTPPPWSRGPMPPYGSPYGPPYQ